MRRINRLRLEALESCNWRGHKMERFKYRKWTNRIVGWSGCKICGKSVNINSNPAPNGIDIVGEAVALGCN